MEEYQIVQWNNFANDFPNCRYPLYNIRVNCLGSNLHNSKVNFLFETMVSNKKKDRICFVADQYEFTGQYTEQMMSEAVKRFKDKCELTKEHYIFEGHSTYEPFEFNK